MLKLSSLPGTGDAADGDAEELVPVDESSAVSGELVLVVNLVDWLAESGC